MKKLIFLYTPILLLSILVIGCGQQSGLSLGSDGYGKTTLPNGINVLVNQDKTTSLTSATILIGGGVLTETAENNGITNLMIKLLLKGNAEMTASEITEELDFLGANVAAGCSRDFCNIFITSLTENFDRALEIVSKCLISPTFPDDELKKLKVVVEGNIKSSDDNQSASSSKLFWKTAFGEKEYGLPTSGTLESIAGIAVEDIKSHYQKYVGGKNVIFAVSSDMPAEKLYSLVDSRLSGLKPVAETVAEPEFTLQSEKEGFISFDRNQSFIYLGYVFDHLQPEEVAYLRLVHDVMGNGAGCRLWFLRFTEKLAYSVYTQYATNKYTTMYRAAIGTDTSKVGQALESLNRELTKLVEEGITADELAIAKAKMKNNLIYWIETKNGRASNMANYEYYGYGYRFILDLINMADGVTLEQVNSFIKDKLTNDRKYLSIVGKK